MSQYRQRVIFASANIYPFVWSVSAESGAEFVFSRPSATGAYFAYVTERERRR